MNIQAVQTSLVKGLKVTGSAIVNSVSWAGHKISTNAVPAIQKIWELTQSAARGALQLAKAGPIWPFAVAATLLAVSVASFGCSVDEEDEDAPKTTANTAWKIAGITSGIGFIAATTIGVTALFV